MSAKKVFPVPELPRIIKTLTGRESFSLLYENFSRSSENKIIKMFSILFVFTFNLSDGMVLPDHPGAQLIVEAGQVPGHHVEVVTPLSEIGGASQQGAAGHHAEGDHQVAALLSCESYLGHLTGVLGPGASLIVLGHQGPPGYDGRPPVLYEPVPVPLPDVTVLASPSVHLIVLVPEKASLGKLRRACAGVARVPADVVRLPGLPDVTGVAGVVTMGVRAGLRCPGPPRHDDVRPGAEARGEVPAVGPRPGHEGRARVTPVHWASSET